MSGEVVSAYFCTDGVECCALKWGINALDRDADKAPQKVRAEIIKMRNALAVMYNEYASGQRPCSRCQRSAE